MNDAPNQPSTPDGRTSAADTALSDKVRALRLGPTVVSDGGAGGWRARVLWAILFGGALLIVAVAVLALVARPAGNETAAPATVPKAGEPAPVSAVASANGIAHQAKGYIIPARQIRVTPKVSGMLLRLNVQEGLRVKKGEVLAVVEDIEYRADVMRAKAVVASAEQSLLELERGSRPEEIKQAEADLAESEAQRVQLEAEVKRNEGLADKKVLSLEEYERTYSRYVAMDRRVARLKLALQLMQIGPRVERIDLAKADLERAKADLKKADWRLENCTILAPISGTILLKNAEEGNIVNPIAFSGSFSICDMADLSDLEVDLSIEERSISKIHKGQKCKVRADAFDSRVYDGYVSRLMPIADRAKASISVRVKVTVPAEEEGVYLKPEMGVEVSFLEDASAKVPGEKGSTDK